MSIQEFTYLFHKHALSTTIPKELCLANGFNTVQERYGPGLPRVERWALHKDSRKQLSVIVTRVTRQNRAHLVEPMLTQGRAKGREGFL